MRATNLFHVAVAGAMLSGCYTTSQSTQRDTSGSSISLATANLVGNGTDIVTVALASKSGVPIANSIVQVDAAGCDVTQPTQATDANGLTTALIVSCSAAGQHNLTAEIAQGAALVALDTNSTLKTITPATPGGTDVQAGFPLNAQAVARGITGAPNVTYQGTVHFTSSDPIAILPADYTFTGSEHGVKVWQDAVTFRTVGTQTVTATDTATQQIVLRETYTVSAGPAANLTVSQLPASSNAGQAFTVTVTATDTTGATLSNYTGTVGFISSDPNAVLPAATPFLPTDAGKKTFSVVLKTAGAQTLQASDGSISSIPQSVSVIAGAAAKLRLSVPEPFVAGTPAAVTLQSTDVYGNVVPTYTGTVHFSSSDPNINTTSSDPNVRSLPVDTPFNGGSTGTMVFPKVTLVTAGTQTLSAGDTQDPNFLTTQPVLVVGGAAVNWVITGDANTWVAGVADTVVVTALDTYNNQASLYRGLITFHSSDPNSTIPSPYTFTATDAGRKVFTNGLTWAHSGAQTVSITDFIARRGGSLPGVVQANTVTSFLLSGNDNPAYVNKDSNVTISAIDNWGNVNPNYTGRVHFTSSDGNALLPSDTLFQTSTQGVALAGIVRFAHYGTQTLTATSTTMPSQTATATIAVHQVHTLISHAATSQCAIVDSGQLRCWGENQNAPNDCSACSGGQLGLGDTLNRGAGTSSMGANLPNTNVGTGRTVVKVSGGEQHRCALLDDATVKCWGDNTNGELGTGDFVARGNAAGTMGDALPAVFLGNQRTAVDIIGGRWGTCARLDDQNMKCWGYGPDGELGLGDALSRGGNANDMQQLPDINLGTGRTVLQMDMGGYHSCAVLDNHQIKCWGFNGEGELGMGDSNNRGAIPGQMGDALPFVPLGTGRSAQQVVSGLFHNCALLDNAQVKCWGRGADACLGYEDPNSRGANPNQMGDNLPYVNLGTGRTVTLLAAGNVHTCAILDDASLKCWGQNEDGRLGVGNAQYYGYNPGTMGDNLPAVSLPTGRTITQLMAGGYQTCVLMDNGLVTCWGDNQQGQAGLANGIMGDIGLVPQDMGNGLLPVVLW